jgi:hypothetical protein
MPTACHLNRRFVDNYFEAAQGVVVRVSSLKKRRSGGRYSVSNDKKKEKLFSYRGAAHFQTRVRHFASRHAVVVSKGMD